MATPRGRPLSPTTDEMVEVTQEDIDRARMTWEEDAPARYRNLLDAELVEEAQIQEEGPS